MMQDDRPMMGLLPRYFDDIIMVDFYFEIEVFSSKESFIGDARPESRFHISTSGARS